MLARVELADGTIVSFAYDDTARRVRKMIAPRGGVALATTIHYVWDGQQIRHAITYRAGSERTVRTYLPSADGEFSPQAHRDDDGEWVHYVSQPNGLPSELVDATGAVVGSLRASVFGLVEERTGQTTDVRALGQLADEELGLFYNRYRYYDPELGRFLSPDPIGLLGGANLYAYGPNPIGWVDPLGWHNITVAGAPAGVPTFFTSGTGGVGTTGCTERQLLAHLEGQPAGSMSNRNISVTGGLPPCPACHSAMQAFASRPGSPSMTYSWAGNGGTNTITYPVTGRESISGPVNDDRRLNQFRSLYGSGADISTNPGAWAAYQRAAGGAANPAGPNRP